jgi:tRNA-intron endonuclease
MEGLYLSEHHRVKVVDAKSKKTVSRNILLKTAKQTYRGFGPAYLVYKDLRNKGYVVTPGIKFGADFAVYEHGPGIDHAPFIISVESPREIMGPFEVVRAGRLATTVRKRFIIAIPDTKTGKIRYLVFQWFKA